MCCKYRELGWATILGQVCGDPVQAGLVGQGGMSTQQAPLTIVETMMDKDNNNVDNSLKRSELPAYQSCLLIVTWLVLSWKFSASSFHPDRDGFQTAMSLNARAHSRFGIAKEAGKGFEQDGNDSDIETEDDWFDDPYTDTPKNTSNLSNAVAIEVSSFQVS